MEFYYFYSGNWTDLDRRLGVDFNPGRAQLWYENLLSNGERKHNNQADGNQKFEALSLQPAGHKDR